MKVVLIFISAVLLLEASCSRILLIAHVPAYSHYAIGSRLAIALANHGHQVTIVSPYKQKQHVKNLREIVLTGFAEEMEELMRKAFGKSDGVSTSQRFVVAKKMFVDGTADVLEHEAIKQLFEPGKQFDLVILEKFGEEPLMGFAHYFRLPYMLYATVGSSVLTNTQVGISNNPAYIPQFLTGFSNELTFFERVSNTLVGIVWIAVKQFYILPSQNEILHRYFPDAPHISDLYYNTSLILLNSHPSYMQSVPLVENTIEIGGFHIEPPKPLSKDLQTYLDNAKEGVIYFSMGSNFKSQYFPPERINALLKVFSRLKQKILWKYEVDDLPNKPSNVKIDKWLPQQDILAHPNVKLFITHGGLLSTTEAVYHGVPLLALPVLGDQFLNAKTSAKEGYAQYIPAKDVNEENFSSTIEEMLANPKFQPAKSIFRFSLSTEEYIKRFSKTSTLLYTNNAKQKSQLFHDRPMKPIDTAIYWVEYVIRNRGAPHLKSITTKLAWYQITLLDVIGFLLVTVYLTIKIVVFVCKAAFCKKRRYTMIPGKKND